MLVDQRDEFHYLTVTNENLPQPALPAGAEADVLRGAYRLHVPQHDPAVRLMAAFDPALHARALTRCGGVPGGPAPWAC